MENQFVNFKIITRNNKAKPYRWAILAAIVFPMVFIISYDEPAPGIFTLIVLCIMFGALVGLNIKLQLLKEYDEIGWVMLAYDYIIVRSGNEETEYALDETTSLLFQLKGYDGEPVIGRVINHKKGIDNYVTLLNDNRNVKYEILVSNKMKISILERLLGHYRRCGVAVKFVDRSGDDSKAALFLRLLRVFGNS